MSDEVAKKLVRQLKFINFYLAFFGTLILIAFIGSGLVAWKIAVSVNETRQQINSVTTSTTDNLDLKKKLCTSDSSVSTFVKANTDTCK